ncbi:MAG TPA: phosphomannomutase/phosphoglucomutase [Phycisphaerae bacterium]
MQTVKDYYRYCPDQVKVLISDAVCVGRRRSNYPPCRGCQFNDDERQASGQQGSAPVLANTTASGGVRREERTLIDKVFKAYDVRATYPDPLNEDVAWRIGYATAGYLRSLLRGMQRGDPRSTSLVVGRDMRQSSPALSAAFIAGARASGATVIDIGMIDTSQIYFAINFLATCGGVQTTASHNPAKYNGFKISGQKGTPIGSDTGLAEICQIASNVIKHDTGECGALTQRDLTADYKAFVRRFLRTPKPLRIVVDASNGMAGKWVPIVLGDVPELDLIPLNFEHSGEFVHEPNPLVDANLRQLRDEVLRSQAHFGVCFDGDADRCILVDERAEIIRCDLLTALLARMFLRSNPGATVVYDLRSSRVVAEEIRKHGGKPRRERVGHAFMKKALAESQGVLGGELSGHFYFRDNYYCDSGLLALVHVINLLSEADGPSDRALSAMINELKRYSASGERNFENAQKDATIRKLAEVYASAKIDYLDGITVQYDDWWFNVRKSNTEPLLRLNLEANTRELMEKKLAEVAALLGKPVEH